MYRVPSPLDPGPESSRARASGPRAGLGLALAAVVALAACGDEPPGVTPGPEGPLRVTLVSPNGAEGAALFELPVEGVSAVRAPLGALLEAQAGGQRQVAVVLSQPGAITLELTVADQTEPPAVRILQVSGPDDRARTLTGYRVQIEVPR